jgi:hypothetical protein
VLLAIGLIAIIITAIGGVLTIFIILIFTFVVVLVTGAGCGTRRGGLGIEMVARG